MKLEKSLLIKASGTVQGVGFRPFVFNLAKKFSLAGYIRNTGFGAEIFVCGTGRNAGKFISKLRDCRFDLSLEIKSAGRAPGIKKYETFSIIKSKKTEILSEFPPDLALCGECKKELFSAGDRRYLYPFINCVKCGPRFSIIKKLPYDRKYTTMKEFVMCKECRKEYGDPSDRRFHAQPDACRECGPRLSLFLPGKKFVSEKNAALADAVRFLKQGKILAVKSIGGYHLCCDASNLKAVKKLRKKKQRPNKPFAVMCGMKTAKSLCFINKYEQEELLSKSAPIVILNKKRRGKMTDVLAPGNSTLGIMLPYAPLHELLVKEVPALVMTSGNKSDEPICIDEKEAFENLGQTADYFLVHDREIENRLDDSIVRFLPDSEEKIMIRRSRGYVPLSVKTAINADMFAAGGDLKNNFCFIRKGSAYLSQYTGDLADNANIKFYDESIGKMKSFLNINPNSAVCDAHPGYHSSQYVKDRFRKVNFACHHYAHMASVVAEHNLKGDVLGFVFDGNGYGEDGNIWGGEILLYRSGKFTRSGHFDYFSLPGGDICAKEVWRCAVSLLHKYGLVRHMPSRLKKYNYKTPVKMIDNNINSPLTSSAGRIFDAVAALTGIKEISSFEAEAAIALESAAHAHKTVKYYAFDIDNGTVGMRGILEGILKDIKNGLSPGFISAKFHNTMAEIIVQTARKHKTGKIALSGGVFQNIYLLNTVRQKLLSSGFNIYYNKQVPINDGGICLGQAFINDKILLKNK